MKSLRLLIPDLFLPQAQAADVLAGLRTPLLETMLARGTRTPLAAESLEAWLVDYFGAAAATVSARCDGLPAGCYLRADPVHLQLQRDKLILLPVGELLADEAESLCVELNCHFSEQGIAFFAPHPQRWYLRLEQEPAVSTVPLSLAFGRNTNNQLPQGEGAPRMIALLNEIQMSLFAHPLNQARDERGLLPVNSVWLWGNDSANSSVAVRNDAIYGDNPLLEMYARAMGLPCRPWQEKTAADSALLVWTDLSAALQNGDLYAWREALSVLETEILPPPWRDLRAGRLDKLALDLPTPHGACNVSLSRGDAWRFWVAGKPLANSGLV
ncbi:MAG: hypothetical protein PHY62_01250 [Gallionella sp.]|nr:hypothetical protein [Gallionella sp.]